jgi:hypothetical protein
MNNFPNATKGAATPDGFDEKFGARSLELQQYQKIRATRYVLGYSTAAAFEARGNISRMIEEEGEFIAIDPTLSVGMVVVRLNAGDKSSTSSGSMQTPIILAPGDIYRGRFKSLMVTSLDGAVGVLYTGYGSDVRMNQVQQSARYGGAGSVVGSVAVPVDGICSFPVPISATVAAGTNTLSPSLSSMVFGGVGGNGNLSGAAILGGTVSLCLSFATGTTPAPPALNVSLRGFGGTVDTGASRAAELTGLVVVPGATDRMFVSYKVPRVCAQLNNTNSSIQMLLDWNNGGVITSAATQSGGTVEFANYR